MLHPALDTDPGHAIWRRGFTGACELLASSLRDAAKPAHAFLNALTLFGMGASWGAYTRALPFSSTPQPSARPPVGRPSELPVHHVSDLIANLERGFVAIAAARG